MIMAMTDQPRAHRFSSQDEGERDRPQTRGGSKIQRAFQLDRSASLDNCCGTIRQPPAARFTLGSGVPDHPAHQSDLTHHLTHPQSALLPGLLQ